MKYLDYTITWKHICDEMYKRFGISSESTEKFTMVELEAYINKIWNDYAFDKDMEYAKLRRERDQSSQ